MQVDHNNRQHKTFNRFCFGWEFQAEITGKAIKSLKENIPKRKRKEEIKSKFVYKTTEIPILKVKNCVSILRNIFLFRNTNF